MCKEIATQVEGGAETHWRFSENSERSRIAAGWRSGAEAWRTKLQRICWLKIQNKRSPQLYEKESPSYLHPRDGCWPFPARTGPRNSYDPSSGHLAGPGAWTTSQSLTLYLQPLFKNHFKAPGLRDRDLKGHYNPLNERKEERKEHSSFEHKQRLTLHNVHVSS